MSLIESLKKVRSEVGVSRNFPVTHLNSPSVFETKSGFLGSVIEVEGAPFVTETPEQLNTLSYTLHQAIACLDERFICYATVHRQKENMKLEGAFKSTFAKRVNDKYHARFQGLNLYKNRIYLTVVLKGDLGGSEAKIASWLNRMLNAGSSDARRLRREENLKILNNTMRQLIASLSKFRPTLLGTQDDKQGVSELMTFLSLIPNAGDTLSLSNPAFCPPIAKSIPDTFIEDARYPEGNLGQYICSKHIMFGDLIQFQGASSNDVRFGALLSIKKYGTDTGSIVLSPLLSLNCEFVSTHTFAPLARDTALGIINRKRTKLINTEDLGETQIRALNELEDALASELTRMGFHHNTLLLIAPTQKQVESAINEAVKVYAMSGMTNVRETLGSEAAFWAQIPGNHAFIARASLITSQNFVDFCPFHNYQTGFKDGNHLGSAVTILETPSKTPVYFNYHGKGSSTNPAKGHSVIFGGNNAGKTTFVSFMDSQMERYHGRSFFLDRDNASKIYILASGNSRYFIIAPGKMDNCQMNPLQMPDIPENRTFLKIWFAQLIKQPGEDDLPSNLGELVNECINYNFEHLDKPYRTLSNIAKFFPVDFQRWPELRRWIKGTDNHGDGEFSWLFDNNCDAMELGFDKVGYDITYLMDEVSHLISTPVYLYIVHRMRQNLDGRLTSIVIDEAFQVFNSPFWVAFLRDWLPTIRKKNGHFVFMTQSPQTVIDSAIRSVILDNVATTILFANPQASRSTYIDHLKLSESEYQAIKNNSPESRLFLYKQENEAILCKLDLSVITDEIRVLSGNVRSTTLVDSLIDEFGDNQDVWLPNFIERSAV
jgi:type IV secretion system protein VirB4